MATDYGDRLRAARNAAGLTQVQLSQKTGIPQSTISSAEKIGLSSTHTAVYASALGVSAIWLATGEGEMTPPQMGVAQVLILDEVTVPSTRTIDELRQMSAVPPSFRLLAPDDALSPKVPRGMPLIMSATNTASPNQVILVRDRSGGLHLRRYGQAVGGWRAIATNDAYLTLESERDGLELVAALRWVDGTAF